MADDPLGIGDLLGTAETVAGQMGLPWDPNPLNSPTVQSWLNPDGTPVTTDPTAQAPGVVYYAPSSSSSTPLIIMAVAAAALLLLSKKR